MHHLPYEINIFVFLKLQGSLQAEHPEYASEIARFNSYHEWPTGVEQRPEVLAKAGFYYEGKSHGHLMNSLPSFSWNSENMNYGTCIHRKTGSFIENDE